MKLFKSKQLPKTSSKENVSSTSKADKVVLKFFLSTDQKTYWTVSVDSTHTAEEVCAQISDKLGNQAFDYVLIKRSKGSFGIRKERVIPKDAVVLDVDERQRKKKRPYTFVVKSIPKQEPSSPLPEEKETLKSKVNSMLFSPIQQRVIRPVTTKFSNSPTRFFSSSPSHHSMPPNKLSLAVDTASPPSSPANNQRRLSTSHSMPIPPTLLRDMQKNNRIDRSQTALPGHTHETPVILKSPAQTAQKEKELLVANQLLQRSPSGLQKSPPVLQKTPSGLQKSPSGLHKSPSGLHKTPSGLQKTPSGLQKSDSFKENGSKRHATNDRIHAKREGGTPPKSSPISSVRDSPRNSPRESYGTPPNHGVSFSSLSNVAPRENYGSSNLGGTPPNGGILKKHTSTMALPSPRPHITIATPDDNQVNYSTPQAQVSVPPNSIRHQVRQQPQRINALQGEKSVPFIAQSVANKQARRKSSPVNGRLSQKEALVLMRFYASDDGDFDGPCWTLAIYPTTTAREICQVIENHLALRSPSLKVCASFVFKDVGGRIERQLSDSEVLLLVREEWLVQGQVPFFFFREINSSINVKDIPRRPVPPPQRHLIPNEWRRSTDATRLAGKLSQDMSWKRRSIPIFLGGNLVPTSSESMDTPNSPSSPDSNTSPVDPSSLNSSADWSLETGKGDKRHSIVVPWINPHELKTIKKVGTGSYSKVYKGFYRGNVVAIKTLKGVATEDQVESFKKEFDILSLTNSPHLIRFYGACLPDMESQSPALSMVVEYCEKGSLHQALNNRKLDLDWQTFFKWIHQAISGVNYLHCMNPPLVHRDLKAHNLLLDHRWNVKVADFGLSRTMTVSNASSLGMLRGTMAYCAPEIYDAMFFTEKSDVYSLGIVIWEMITRLLKGQYQAPFAEHSEIHYDFQIIIQTARNGLRPTLHPKTPRVLIDLLNRCWSKNPDDRPTCQELLVNIQLIYVQYKNDVAEWEKLREMPSDCNISLQRPDISMVDSPRVDLRY